MGNDDMMVNWWLTANQPWLPGTSSSKMIKHGGLSLGKSNKYGIFQQATCNDQRVFLLKLI